MTQDSFDVDDSYDGVLDQNAAHIRTAALWHLRDAGEDEVALVELPESGGVLVDVIEGFGDVDSGRAALAELAPDPRRRIFLVVRPAAHDLTRPAPQPDVDVEWIDNGERHATRITG